MKMLYHAMGDSLFLSSVCIASIFRLHFIFRPIHRQGNLEIGVGEKVNRHVAVTPID